MVTDVQSRPVAGATIGLYLFTDPTKKRTAVAREDGSFQFKNLPEGQYMLGISSIGFKNFTSSAITVGPGSPAIRLPVIVLALSRQPNLQEVVVSAHKPLVEYKIDRTIVNVDAMKDAVGNSALEVLEKSPGVTVDFNGDISLNGKGGVLVLIDDRSTYLSMQDLAAYLRSLPAGSLEKIELMSNPPSKYDASGSAIINLVLKKSRNPGINGNISLGYSQGNYSGFNQAINSTYRGKKFRVFGNLSYTGNESYNREQYQRFLYDPNGLPVSGLFMNSRYTVNSTAWNGRLGVDYFISPKTTVGLLLMGNTRPKTDRLVYGNNLFDDHMQPDSTGEGFTEGDYSWRNSGINLNIQHKLNDSGQSLTADFDHLKYTSFSSQFSPTWMYFPDGSLSSYKGLKMEIPSDMEIYSAKLDYTLPPGKDIRVDAGFKFSQVTTDNHSTWFNQSGNSFVPDENRTNHFIYKEQIHAVYASATREWKRWAVQGGLRMESVGLHGHLVGTATVKDSLVHQTYTNLFPTLFISYKLDSAGNHRLKLSYERRIRRPNYQQLNPFLVYRDGYNFSAGNPYLKPHYNNFVELDYNYKHSFGVTLLYGRINGIIQSLTQAVGDTFITRPENFGVNYSFDFIPHATLSPFKWWNLNTTLVMFYLVNKGKAYGEPVNNKVVTAEWELSNQFVFKDEWSVDLSMFFGSRHKGGQTISDPSWSMNASVQKTIFAKKGTLRLGLDDVFHSRIMQISWVGLQQASAFRKSWSDTRRIRLGFTYRFGKELKERKRIRNSGGAGEEEGRAN